MDTTKTAMAFFAGLAVGATLGALLSPEKGSDLRADIKDKLGKTIKDTADQVKRSVKKGIDEFSSGFTSTEEEFRS
ncbi:YtxH domain-containing protein [Solitalea longa]|uniref:YtxH domain-containing protein n=1 Tax=Solitalea longa TaxID=2079460 RepID=A0A2S5A4T6_9SPHI|nr:YtxH domain-containing protein [Solitalea longa]POY37307.1 YtxH domain-containing protein [Solitalea longa]